MTLPFHTIVPFSFSDFLGASLDFLLAHPLALGLLMAGALLVAFELCLLAAKESARRRSAKNTADRLAAWTVAQAQQKDVLVHTRMKSVVNLTEHRRNTKGAA